MEDNNFNNVNNLNTADTAPVTGTGGNAGDNEPLYVVTPHRLNNHYLKKFKLSEETRVIVPGCELKKRKLKENEDESVKLYRYFSEAENRKRKKLMKGTQVDAEGETAYFFCPNEWLPFIILFFCTLLILGIILVLGLRGCGNTPVIQLPQHNVIGEDKETQENTQAEDDGIIYAGFPDSFTINSKVRYLSVQNSVENKDRFYTTVKLLEGDKVIYDMKDDVIEPGKYVNIDLYSLLDKGEHKITICQAGYVMNEKFTPVATSTSQVVTVNVEK